MIRELQIVDCRLQIRWWIDTYLESPSDQSEICNLKSAIS